MKWVAVLLLGIAGLFLLVFGALMWDLRSGLADSAMGWFEMFTGAIVIVLAVAIARTKGRTL